MSRQALNVRRVLGIGLSWSALWLVFAMLLSVVIGIFDPDSLDDGDARGVMMIFSLMGFLSGLLFAIATWLAGRPSAASLLSVSETMIWGVIATAIVQTGFLGHGDAGLAANVRMALLFCVFGGLIAISWLAIARAFRVRK